MTNTLLIGLIHYYIINELYFNNTNYLKLSLIEIEDVASKKFGLQIFKTLKVKLKLQIFETLKVNELHLQL